MSATTRAAMRDEEERRRQAGLERALTCAFWRAVQSEPMPVMAALEAAARALGTLYRQTAAVHGPGGACGCGWQPDPETDGIVLEAMLAAAMRAPQTEPVATEPRDADALASMPVAGRA